jgi:hypothetical protein
MGINQKKQQYLIVNWQLSTLTGLLVNQFEKLLNIKLALSGKILKDHSIPSVTSEFLEV